jgi:hypothetical protein
MGVRNPYCMPCSPRFRLPRESQRPSESRIAARFAEVASDRGSAGGAALRIQLVAIPSLSVHALRSSGILAASSRAAEGCIPLTLIIFAQ